MFYYFILYMIIFQIKFVLIISGNYKSISNGLINILKIFWQLIISNPLKTTINTNETKLYHHIFFKNFINKFFLANKLERERFLDLRSKKKDLIS